MDKLSSQVSSSFLHAEWALHIAILINFGGRDQDVHSDLVNSLYSSDDETRIARLDKEQIFLNDAEYQMQALLNDISGRHIMVITESPGPMIAWMESYATYHGDWVPESFVGSCLEYDRVSSEIYAQSLLQGIIVSMATERRLLILHNLDIIYAALYDVFNSNYSRSGGEGTQRYCRIARAAFCNPRCAVAEQFKVVLVVTPERAKMYEPALLNRFAKIRVDLHNLVYSKDFSEVSKLWESATDIKSRSGWRETDFIPACPSDLCDIVALSTIIQSENPCRHGGPGAENNPDFNAPPAAHLADSSVVFANKLTPLMTPQLISEDYWNEMRNISPNMNRALPTFEQLIVKLQQDSEKGATQTIIPVLVPTFKAGTDRSSNAQSMSLKNIESFWGEGNCGVCDVHSAIVMKNEVSEAALRSKISEHIRSSVSKMEKRARRNSAKVVSVLHVHVDMGTDRAQDQVDYMRTQIEWGIRELTTELQKATNALYVQGEQRRSSGFLLPDFLDSGNAFWF